MEPVLLRKTVGAQSKELVLQQLLMLLVKQITMELIVNGIQINVDSRNVRTFQVPHIQLVINSDPVVQWD